MSGIFEGKHVLLTGATGGIGAAAAREFAKGGALLTVVAHDATRGQALLAQLKALAPRAEDIALELADFSSLEQVRSLVRRYRAEHQALDVLANNAGMLYMQHSLTVDGLERTFEVDHLAAHTLTQGLLPLLRATPGSRVITTASSAHQLGRMNLGLVAKRPNGKAGWAAYGDAKLANILFASELARREAGQVFSFSFHPGWVRTGFALNNRGFYAAFNRMAGALFARKPEKGAETLLWLAQSDEPLLHNGGYFVDKALRQPSRAGHDAQLAQGLWALSEQLAGPAA